MSRDAYRHPASLEQLSFEPLARLIVDQPLASQLALGRAVIGYRTENIRIRPVYGPAALGVSPRVGHLHITVDDAVWHWLDASDEPLVITRLAPGPHTILMELADPVHRIIDHSLVSFEIPSRTSG